MALVTVQRTPSGVSSPQSSASVSSSSNKKKICRFPNRFFLFYNVSTFILCVYGTFRT